MLKVFGKEKIFGNKQVFGKEQIFGNRQVFVKEGCFRERAECSVIGKKS